MPRLCRFLLPPFILLAALLAYRLAYHCVQTRAAAPRRNEPLVIPPRFDEPRVVTDQQLSAVLDRVKPPTGPLKTNNLVHALRLWGVEADFHDPAVPTGRQMRDYLLDDCTFRQFAGQHAPPLFYHDQHGIAVRGYDEQLAHRDTSSYHADDLLATLAETGTPLAAPLRLRDGEATIGQLLDDSLGRFHLDRFEYEWAILSYARYVFPQREFRNQWGERITVDDLVQEAIGPSLELGPCNGLHRLEALVVLYRADEQCRAVREGGLRPATRNRILSHLRQVSDLLAQSQTADGYWTRAWPRGAAALGMHPEKSDLYDRILVTGHHLEWLALAPEEVQPPRETVVRAGQWLARTLVELDEADLVAAYGPYTHAARALALWRSQEPYAAWQRPYAMSVSRAPSPRGL